MFYSITCYNGLVWLSSFVIFLTGIERNGLLIEGQRSILFDRLMHSLIITFKIVIHVFNCFSSNCTNHDGLCLACGRLQVDLEI